MWILLEQPTATSQQLWDKFKLNVSPPHSLKTQNNYYASCLFLMLFDNYKICQTCIVQTSTFKTWKESSQILGKKSICIESPNVIKINGKCDLFWILVKPSEIGKYCQSLLSSITNDKMAQELFENGKT